MEKIPISRITAYNLYQNKCKDLFYMKGRDFHLVGCFEDLKKPMYLNLKVKERKRIARLENLMIIIDCFAIFGALMGTVSMMFFLFRINHNIMNLGLYDWWAYTSYNHRFLFILTIFIYHHCIHHLVHLGYYNEYFELKIEDVKKDIIDKRLKETNLL